MSASGILTSTITYTIDNTPNLWEGSVFEDLRFLGSDICGKWGEKFLNDILKSYDLSVEWNEDSNTNAADGKYDMKVNKKRVEVKTSFRGTSRPDAKGKIKLSGWQHENIYKEFIWDKVVFIDVDTQQIYVTVMDHSEMVFDKQHPILGKKPTLRQNKDDGYKFDFSLCTVKYGIKGGLTYQWDLSDEKGLREFLTKKLS